MDTSAEAAEIVFDRLSSMSIDERVALIEKLNHDAETMAIAGIRMEYPGIGDAELRLELFRRRYGDELADEVGEAILAADVRSERAQ